MNPTQKQFSLNRGASRKQIPISFVLLAAALLLALPLSAQTDKATTFYLGFYIDDKNKYAGIFFVFILPIVGFFLAYKLLLLSSNWEYWEDWEKFLSWWRSKLGKPRSVKREDPYQFWSFSRIFSKWAAKGKKKKGEK